ALEAGAPRITDEMKLAAAEAIASVAAEDLTADYIVPSPLDPRVAPTVNEADARAARAEARPRGRGKELFTVGRGTSPDRFHVGTLVLGCATRTRRWAIGGSEPEGFPPSGNAPSRWVWLR